MKREGVLPLAALTLALGTPLLAQATAPAPSFGVDAVTILNVSVWDAQAADSLTTWFSIPTIGHRYQLTSGSLVASAHLPDGAMLVSFELEACDSSNSGVATAVLQADAGGTTNLAAVTTGGTPGCGRFAAPTVTAHTVDNASNQYLVLFSNDSYDGSTSIGGARIGYRLQVSPAPAVPSFGDVPISDPAFAHVEALLRSGITAGCGGGNFCPDAALTRRQMAVFLAKALGLQWPAP